MVGGGKAMLKIYKKYRLWQWSDDSVSDNGNRSNNTCSEENDMMEVPPEENGKTINDWLRTMKNLTCLGYSYVRFTR